MQNRGLVPLKPYERTREHSHPEVTAGRKVILDSRLIMPFEARIIPPFAQEGPAHTKKVLVCDGVQVEEQLGLDHGSCRNDLVHYLRGWHRR